MSEIYRFVIRTLQQPDPRSAGLLADAQALGLRGATRLERQDLYFIEGQVSPEALERLAAELFSDPLTQSARWGRWVQKPRGEQAGVEYSPQHDAVRQDGDPPPPGQFVVEVALRPGVTDPVAEQIVRAARELGVAGVELASTGSRYLLEGVDLDAASVMALTRRLLATPTIQRYTLGEIEPVFPHLAAASGQVDILPVRGLDPDGLLELSQARRAALDLAEMQAVQAYFTRQGRDPTDIEFETVAQTWSEHCVHKTFKARITVEAGGREPAVVDNMLKTYLRAATEKINAPWVRSAFVDNAGILEFDEEFEVSFKVETHNHPSAIEPFGGANTGVGGVIRDVLGVSARPIANTDVLCFGPQDQDPATLPEGILHPRRIRSGVVAGVQDYGNKMGIPTVNGAILYDPGYTANPLVFCGCVGLAPKNRHPRQPRPGDRVIVIGGRTGRDGLRGATFSSMTMDAQTGEVSGASVQIGDPITEKGVMEVVVRARDLGLYHAITDCGAGGLSSAVGEMGSQMGVEVDLVDVRLKYPGLAPWEIWLSEAQERMVLAVGDSAPPGAGDHEPTALARLISLCDLFDVEWRDIGEFTDTGRLVVKVQGRVVLNLENAFLHEGIPQRKLVARVENWGSQGFQGSQGSNLPHLPLGAQPHDNQQSVEGTLLPEAGDNILVEYTQYGLASNLLALLGHPNIASKADVIRIYDHEVQGGTVVKPLTGILDDGPSDAAVLKPQGTRGVRGLALANGINPEYGKLDAYRMAWSVVDEAVRNAVTVGADPQRIGLLDNFCWGDPKRPETLGTLLEAVRGCHDAAVFYQTPFISGKDSLNNEYLGSDGQRHAIPPTLLISSIGIVEDIGNAVTMDLKEPGDVLYLVGEHQPTWGGSHYAGLFGSRLHGLLETDATPHLGVEYNPYAVPGKSTAAPALYRALHAAMQAGLVRAGHDLSEGGLAVAAAEMCLGGRLGLRLDLEEVDPHLALFGETNGCLLVEVKLGETEAFERQMEGLPWKRIGTVGAGYNPGAEYDPGAEYIPQAESSPEAGIRPGFEPGLLITVAARPVLSIPLEAIAAAWLPGERKV